MSLELRADKSFLSASAWTACAFFNSVWRETSSLFSLLRTAPVSTACSDRVSVRFCSASISLLFLSMSDLALMRFSFRTEIFFSCEWDVSVDSYNSCPTFASCWSKSICLLRRLSSSAPCTSIPDSDSIILTESLSMKSFNCLFSSSIFFKLVEAK